jgi:hypothetical protein
MRFPLTFKTFTDKCTYYHPRQMGEYSDALCKRCRQTTFSVAITDLSTVAQNPVLSRATVSFSEKYKFRA